MTKEDNHHLFTFYFLVFLILVHSAFSTDTVEFVKNKTPATLSRNYFKASIGSFKSYPPSTIQPHETGNWSLSGSITHDVGWIEADVWYGSASFQGCVDFYYFWDLVIGECGGDGFASCPGNESSEKKVIVGKGTGRAEECYFFISWSHCHEGNPVHTLTTNCTG